MNTFRFLFALLLLLLLIVAGASPAAAQHAAMVQSIHYSTEIGNMRSTTDAAGNTYVAGCFGGLLEIAGTQLTAPANEGSNIYYAKLDAAGQLKWLIQGGSDSTDIVYNIATDNAGSVYVTGTNPGAGFLIGRGSGSRIIDSAGTHLVKLNATTGAVQWARTVGKTIVLRGGQPMGIRLYGVAPTATDLYIGGSVINNDSLDHVALQNPGAVTSAFVARCNPADGEVTRVWQCIPSDAASISSLGVMRVAANGDVVTILGHRGTVQIGGAPGSASHTATLAPTNQYEFCLVRLTPTLAGGTTQHLIDRLPRTTALALDPRGNCYIGGFSGWGAAVGNVLGVDSGAFVARIDRAGTTRWVTIGQTPGINTLAGQMTDMSFHPGSGQLYTGGQMLTNSLQFGAYTVSTTQPNSPSSFLVSLDSTGGVRWARGADLNSGYGDFTHSIGVDAANRVYLSGFTWGASGTSTVPIRYDGLAVRPGSSYVVRFDPAAEVTGTVYLDQNGNGVRDTSEPGFPRSVMVQEVGGAGHMCISGPTGLYHALLPAGVFALEALPPAHYSVSAPLNNRQAGTLASVGTVVSGRDFGLAPILNQTDVRVTLTPYTAARRGFVSRYRVRVENVGTVAATGQVDVQLDSHLTYLTATPTPTQQTGNTLQWNFSGLAPFSSRTFDISTTIPLNVALGTIIRSWATGAVPNDLDPTNDADSTRQTVIGSWDPNELTVNYSTLTPAQIAAGTELDYIIHFQNLGTDTAFTVVLTDTLPAHLLQLGTLYIASQSHDCRVDLLGNRQLVIRFDHINLPPNRTSALESGGFIRFRVRPRPTLVAGELIPNTAHIVFDYNAPLATNEVTTLVQRPNGLVAEPHGGDTSMRLYPNPATETVTLPGAEAGATVTLFDALGRPVATSHLAPDPSHLDLRGLAPGLYMVRLALPDGHTTSQRLVVR